MEDDLKTLREKGMGIQLGDEQRHCISNMRFADDVSTSLNQLKKMMTDFRGSTEKCSEDTPRQDENPMEPKIKQTQRCTH